MKREPFKIIAGLQLIANLVLSIYIIVIVSMIVFIIKPNLPFLVLFISTLVLYIILVFFEIIATKKIKTISFKGTSKEIVKEVHKYSYWFFFPLLFSITVQKLRKAMWDYYAQSKTSHLTKESDIMKEHIKLLEDLRNDEFISRYYYEKQKPRLEETYYKLLEIEKITKKKEKYNRIKKSKLSAKNIEDAKWN